MFTKPSLSTGASREASGLFKTSHCPQVPRARHLWTIEFWHVCLKTPFLSTGASREASKFVKTNHCTQVARARHLWTVEFPYVCLKNPHLALATAFLSKCLVQTSLLFLRCYGICSCCPRHCEATEHSHSSTEMLQSTQSIKKRLLSLVYVPALVHYGDPTIHSTHTSPRFCRRHSGMAGAPGGGYDLRWKDIIL